MNESRAPIDWAQFDGLPEAKIECACGALFDSHSTLTASGIKTCRKPCPNCGSHFRVRRVVRPHPVLGKERPGKTKLK